MPEAVVRKPWLGDCWREAGSLLIVGESHYWHEDPEDPEVTRIVLADVVGGGRHRFFTTIERVVTGRDVETVDPADFWHSVAFMNFCPGAVPDRDVSATPEMFQRGIEAFPAVLLDLRPRRVLFVSKRSWVATEKLEGVLWTEAETFEHGLRKQDTGFFHAPDFEPGAYSMLVNHPAWPGWKHDDWRPLVRDFLARPLAN